MFFVLFACINPSDSSSNNSNDDTGDDPTDESCHSQRYSLIDWGSCLYKKHGDLLNEQVSEIASILSVLADAQPQNGTIVFPQGLKLEANAGLSKWLSLLDDMLQELKDFNTVLNDPQCATLINTYETLAVDVDTSVHTYTQYQTLIPHFISLPLITSEDEAEAYAAYATLSSVISLHNLDQAQPPLQRCFLTAPAAQ